MRWPGSRKQKASRLLPTTHGPTSSAACWSRRSIPISDAAGRKSCASIPVHEAALARRIPGRPSTSERFELFVSGVELANGFGELTDPAAQRANLESEMQERQRIYGERYPLDEDFLAALAHMPPASGCALGFDRLVMLATGATTVEQVIWTPLVDTGK